MEKARFYLSTYPALGGLMTLFALKYQCIPLTLCCENNRASNPKTLVLHPEAVEFTFYNKKTLFEEIDRIMNDAAYYKNAKRKLEGQIITRDEFIEQLSMIMDVQDSKYRGKKENIDLEGFLKIYKKNAAVFINIAEL